MNKKDLILLRALLKSTSGFNILKYSKDKKKKGRVIGSGIGLGILYAMIMGYAVATCIGYMQYGLIDQAPMLCAMVVSLLAFILTFLRTNGYLFNFREYDLLMSYPFEASSVAKCKFLYMYIKGLPWYLSISLAVMAVYGIATGMNVVLYPLWILLTLFLPLIPMLAASFLGFIIARLSIGFRNKTIVQSIFSAAFVMLVMFSRFFLEDMFKNDKVEDVLGTASQSIGNAGSIYLPIKWFSDAVTVHSVPAMILLTGVSAALFMVLFLLVGRSYAQINSSLKSHAASRKFKMKGSVQRSVVNAVAFKEFRRMTGSTTYLVNCGLGVLFSILIGLAFLIVGFDKIVATVTEGAPLTREMLLPAIPFMVYLFAGMMSTCACSPSLEGKNYWIVQSLPLSKRKLYQGKILFNLYLLAPPMLFATLCVCISARAGLVYTAVCLLTALALMVFSSTWGCVCGIRFMKLDWENEVEVIKQGAATALYLLPNMFVTMGLVVLMVILGTVINATVLMLITFVIVSALALLCYLRAMSLAQKKG